MRDTYTVAQAAAELGITPSAVRYLCIRRNLGTTLTPRLRVLTRADVESLRDRKPEQRRMPRVIRALENHRA